MGRPRRLNLARNGRIRVYRLPRQWSPLGHAIKSGEGNISSSTEGFEVACEDDWVFYGKWRLCKVGRKGIGKRCEPRNPGTKGIWGVGMSFRISVDNILVTIKWDTARVSDWRMSCDVYTACIGDLLDYFQNLIVHSLTRTKIAKFTTKYSTAKSSLTIATPLTVEFPFISNQTCNPRRWT